MENRAEQGLVSVIVPVYNRDKYVAQTIDSILAQSYPGIEVVLINDGSTDSSLDILRSYEQRYPEKVIVIDQQNQGQIAARNHGIMKSRGQFIAFLDSDDLWYPNKLALQLPLFKDNVGLVYTAVEHIDQHGTVIHTELCDESLTDDIYMHLLVHNRMTGGSVVVTRAALEQVGLFDPAFKAAENWDLWLRICRQYRAALVNQVLVKYRIHPENMSSNQMLMLQAKEKIIQKHSVHASTDDKVEAALTLARADLWYRYGLVYASRADYVQARKFFKQSYQLAPNYKDVKQRIIRSYLGKSGNRLLAATKKLLGGRN